MRPAGAARRETPGPGAPNAGVICLWPHLLRMDVATTAREIEVLLSERRRVSELLLGLLTCPGGLNEDTDHMIAALFDRDAGPRYSRDVKAARSLVEHGEGVSTTDLGGGVWGAEVYQWAMGLDGPKAEQWQTHDCRMDVEAVAHGEAAAIVCALIIVRAVQAEHLIDLAGGNPAMLRRLDLARGGFAPVSAPACPEVEAAPPAAPAAILPGCGRGVLGRLLARAWQWRRGARA